MRGRAGRAALRLVPVCLFLLLYAMISIGSVSAAEKPAVQVRTIHFLPQQFYVGDQVEIRIQIEPLAGITLVSPTKMPESSGLSFKNIRVETEGEYPEIRIRLVSFQPGIRALPAIDLGEAVLQEVKIHTTSVMQDTPLSFVDPFGPVILPGSRLLLVIGSTALLAGPLLLLLFWDRLGKALRGSLRAGRRKLPYRRFQKRMAALAAQEGTLDPGEYYTRLSGEVRSYLSLRLGRNLISATSRESAGILYGEFGDLGSSRSLAEFLSGADRVRFGGEAASAEKRRGDLLLCRTQVENIEETLRKREQQGEREHVDL
jgi:hypothetical protein